MCNSSSENIRRNEILISGSYSGKGNGIFLKAPHLPVPENTKILTPSADAPQATDGKTKRLPVTILSPVCLPARDALLSLRVRVGNNTTRRTESFPQPAQQGLLENGGCVLHWPVPPDSSDSEIMQIG